MAYERSTIPITSSKGKIIETWLYKPSHPEPHPFIIMGAGIGLVKSGGLPQFAKAFASEGYAAISMDYTSFGGSEGTPRNVLSVSEQLQNFRDVIAWARRNNSMFDSSKIVVWGTSFGGMYPTTLLSEDYSIAAGIVQCPCVDGLLASLMIPLTRSIPMTTLAILDVVASIFGLGPIYLTTAATPDSSGVAILKAPDVPEGWARLMPQDGSLFLNHLAARSLFSIMFNRPGQHVGRSIRPFLFVLPEYDSVVSLPAAERAAKKAVYGELVRVKGGHFDVYEGGPSFKSNLEAQVKFLKRVVPVVGPVPT